MLISMEVAMRTLIVLLAVALCNCSVNSANAGLVLFDFKADDTSITGLANATGVVDTIANTFTLQTIQVPTNFPTRSPVLPLVFQAVAGPSLISWDVPDNATAQTIKDELNTFSRGFLLAGRNSDYSWNPNTQVFINATMGWGVGVQNRGTGGQLIQWAGSDSFQRIPQAGVNGTTLIDWTVNFGDSGVTQGVTAVPEPSSGMMLLIGLATLRLASRFSRFGRKQQKPLP